MNSARVRDDARAPAGIYTDQMVVFAGILLLVNAFYNVVVWPRFWTRIAKDPRARDEQGRATTFLTVHAVLIGIALLIAIASAMAGVWVLVA